MPKRKTRHEPPPVSRSQSRPVDAGRRGLGLVLCRQAVVTNSTEQIAVVRSRLLALRVELAEVTAQLTALTKESPLEWRRVAWLPGYETSEFGDLRNLKTGRVCPGGLQKGYRKFALIVNGERATIAAHRLVCEAWHGPAPEGKNLVAHWDGDKLNNHYSNLRWADHADNTSDRIRHNGYTSGEDCIAAKLTDQQVRDIREQYSAKYGHAIKLARQYDVSETYMWRLLRGHKRAKAGGPLFLGKTTARVSVPAGGQ